MKADAEITRQDLNTVVKMIATLTGLPQETAVSYLELYYHVRQSCESGKTVEPVTVRLQTPAVQLQTPEEPKELSPVEKGIIFKQNTRDRMVKAITGKTVSTKKLAEMAGIEEWQIIAIMESKKQPSRVYQVISSALDKLEEKTEKERSEQDGND